MIFELGTRVKVPSYNIDKGVITGVEEYSNWGICDGELQLQDKSPEYDYKVTFIEDGEIYSEWYSEEWVERV